MEDPLFGKPARNFAPRTIWTGDNLDILRGINSETVDLIYLDPPFNSNRAYAAPIGSKAAGAAFKGFVDVGRSGRGMAGTDRVIEAAGTAHSDGMKAYLCMMGVRLLEMHRALAPTGSIYLHCDPTASHYLKPLLDAIFKTENFRSEITWQRSGAYSDARQWGRVADSILFYSRGRNTSSNDTGTSTMTAGAIGEIR